MSVPISSDEAANNARTAARQLFTARWKIMVPMAVLAFSTSVASLAGGVAVGARFVHQHTVSTGNRKRESVRAFIASVASSAGALCEAQQKIADKQQPEVDGLRGRARTARAALVKAQYNERMARERERSLFWANPNQCVAGFVEEQAVRLRKLRRQVAKLIAG